MHRCVQAAAFKRPQRQLGTLSWRLIGNVLELRWGRGLCRE